MDFILRIYFIGLIAFVPDSDGQRMTALLVDARHSYIASDGEQVPEHYPMLFARAQNCSGNCHEQDTFLADTVFPSTLSAGERLTNLQDAVIGGGGWKLDLSQLRIVLPGASQMSLTPFQLVGDGDTVAGPGRPLPSSSTPRDDFDYVADLREIVGESLVVDSTLLDAPEKGRTVALMKLAAGDVTAQRLSGFKDEIVEFRFATAEELKNGLDLSMPLAALADRVMVEIKISGDRVRLEDRNSTTSTVRTMELTPQAGSNVIEVVIVNLPKHGFQFEGSHLGHPTTPGQIFIDHHFELFYELAECVPPRNRRPVPGYLNDLRTERPNDPSQDSSTFLGALGLAPSRGVWSQPTCVVVQLPRG